MVKHRGSDPLAAFHSSEVALGMWVRGSLSLVPLRTPRECSITTCVAAVHGFCDFAIRMRLFREGIGRPFGGDDGVWSSYGDVEKEESGRVHMDCDLSMTIRCPTSSINSLHNIKVYDRSTKQHATSTNPRHPPHPPHLLPRRTSRSRRTPIEWHSPMPIDRHTAVRCSMPVAYAVMRAVCSKQVRRQFMRGRCCIVLISFLVNAIAATGRF